ncbi:MULTISPECIES: hypothetical protein [Microbacterium]|uniref:hypothetical protein n=1 Tax=Microbacterium TaxID=33882 RepID=UPI000786EBA4|nr:MULTISPECIES: hypothetical protein [Microbacterium]KYJ96745.1 cytochrome C5 [Microbacterium sp. CH1]
MASSALDSLLARIVESGVLEDPVSANGQISGRALIDAAGTTVTVTIDLELEDHLDGEVDQDGLLDGVTRILGVNEGRWRAIIDEVAADIDDAVDDEPVAEQTDLRDDLEATSVVVFADALVLSFLAPKQFPDSRVVVQVDEDLQVEDVEVREGDGTAGVEGE